MGVCESKRFKQRSIAFYNFLCTSVKRKTQLVLQAIDASNVMLVCPKCKKGVRVGMSVLENGTKVRVCKKCGATIEA